MASPDRSIDIAEDASVQVLRTFLERSGVDARIVRPGGSAETVTAAAAAAGVESEQIIKTVLFTSSTGDGVLAIVNGPSRVSKAKLSVASGIAGLRLADAATVLALTGFPAGGVPPIGHVRTLPVYVDCAVMAQQRVLGGAGTAHLLLEIAPADIVRMTNAVITDLKQDNQQEARHDSALIIARTRGIRIDSQRNT